MKTKSLLLVMPVQLDVGLQDLDTSCSPFFMAQSKGKPPGLHTTYSVKEKKELGVSSEQIQHACPMAEKLSQFVLTEKNTKHFNW